MSAEWPADVFRIQIAHPFTPIDLEPFKSIEETRAPEWFTHLDKIAFRFSIPLIGKAFHIGSGKLFGSQLRGRLIVLSDACSGR